MYPFIEHIEKFKPYSNIQLGLVDWFCSIANRESDLKYKKSLYNHFFELACRRTDNSYDFNNYTRILNSLQKSINRHGHELKTTRILYRDFVFLYNNLYSNVVPDLLEKEVNKIQIEKPEFASLKINENLLIDGFKKVKDNNDFQTIINCFSNKQGSLTNELLVRLNSAYLRDKVLNTDDKDVLENLLTILSQISLKKEIFNYQMPIFNVFYERFAKKSITSLQTKKEADNYIKATILILGNRHEAEEKFPVIQRSLIGLFKNEEKSQLVSYEILNLFIRSLIENLPFFMDTYPKQTENLLTSFYQFLCKRLTQNKIDYVTRNKLDELSYLNGIINSLAESNCNKFDSSNLNIAEFKTNFNSFLTEFEAKSANLSEPEVDFEDIEGNLNL
jgi:hypothetical protein